LVGLTTSLGIVKTQTAVLVAGYTLMNSSLVAAITPASICEDYSVCTDAVVAAQAEIGSSIGTTAAQVATIAGYVSAVNTFYSAYSMYRSMSDDYSQEFSNTKIEFDTTTKNLYDLHLLVNNSLSSLPKAISSADWLSTQEEESSKAASYDDSTVSLDGEFNKGRLIGLIGNAISSGFVNGAYEGGVYTTKDTFYNSSASAKNVEDSSRISLAESNPYELKEDCENTVSMTLPDYSINLINDAHPLDVSANVSASWDFSNVKVFDVFSEQEAGVIFSDNGLKKNSYGVMEISAVKHEHANPTIASTNFGPFNVPDSEENVVSYKYHLRFDVAPRTGANFVSASNNACVNGLLRGENGASALPSTILAWDWNSISSQINSSESVSSSTSKIGNGGSGEAFIDATQLSILLSKKLGSLNSFLTESNLSCPSNPAKSIVDSIKPILTTADGVSEDYATQSSIETKCFLPLTTSEYDNKPALYYFLESNPRTSDKKWLSDAEVINSPDELLELIDFNANLIRDGYGLDFQYDFSTSYSNKILLAGPSFLNPFTGVKKYFEDSHRAYFSSIANYDKSATKWAIPGAGKYRVRMVIDFQDYPLLFRGGTPSANIVFDLYPIEPVYSNYSPLYYTPIDGFTGLSANNNRRYYGSALLSNALEGIFVTKSDGSVLSTQQKESLVLLSTQEITNPTLMNYSPYLRSKIMEIAYNYSTGAGGDSNSYILYSPSVATPLLFELSGSTGTETVLAYSLTQNKDPYSIKSPSLLLLSHVGDCSDIAGNSLLDYANFTPDMQIGKDFGVVLPKATSFGSTFLKTVAYVPANNFYGLSLNSKGKIYSADDFNGVAKTVSLNGISGMAFNDSKTGHYVNSFSTIYASVTSKSLCVAHNGTKELFFWPEDSLFSEKGLNAGAIIQKENEAKVACVKK
ncbi:MAG: hypothetical protein WCI04_03600, partial [archaeon]